MIACGPLSGPYLVASSDIDGILSDGPNAKKSRRITIILGVCCRIIIQGPLGHASTTCDTNIMYCIAEMYCKEQLSDIIIHGGSLSTVHLPQILENKVSRKGRVSVQDASDVLDLCPHDLPTPLATQRRSLDNLSTPSR